MSYQPVGRSSAGAGHQPSRDAPLDPGKPAHARSPSRSWLPFSLDFGPSRTHTLISVAAGTVMTLFGYEQGVFGGIIIGGEFNDYFSHPSPGMVGFVTSVYDLGCFAGALLTLLVGERLGRKRMLLVFTVIMASGILVQTCAQNMQHLLTATAPVWHVETSHAEAKGKAVVKEMVVNVFGFVVSNIVTLLFSHSTSEAQWRFPLGIQMIFIVVILCLVPLLPESPRWLLARGRDVEAKQVVQLLSDFPVEQDFNELRTSVREEMAVQASWGQIFRGGTNTRRLLLGMLLQVCQQLTGINVLCYYLVSLRHP
jgi:MFS family permease